MKKLLSIIMSLFTLLPVLCAFNVVLAQADVNQKITQRVTKECLTSVWSDCFDYEELVFGEDSDINSVNEHKTLLTVVQDVVLAATYIVWTILTIVIIYCGIMYIFASWSDSVDTKKYKSWLIYAGIWAVLVWWAYTIVRLIQYVAKWS